MLNEKYGDVSVSLEENVALVEIHRPPHNYFDAQLISDLGDAFHDLEDEISCRAVVLTSEGKSFCAGTNFAKVAEADESGPSRSERLYEQALRLFSFQKPIVAAIQGPAIGGGLGVALVADFRVVCPEARFAANFVKVGIHPGFGLTCTLPRLIEVQKASMMFYTGRRITGDDAVSWGLADMLVDAKSLREEARKLAAEIAQGAPLAVQSTRSTLRQGFVEAIRAQIDIELSEQTRLRHTEDHREGVRAVAERGPGRFIGR